MKTKNKIKATILTSLLLLPTLFIGGGINNIQINNKTLSDDSKEMNMDHFGVVSHRAISNGGSYGFSSHMKDGLDHLYMWGLNGTGQLGVGDNINEYQYDDYPMDITGGKNPSPNHPNQVMNKKLESNQKITQLALGTSHSGAVVETTDDNGVTNDHLWMWGDNTKGELGNNSTKQSDSPIDITTELTGGINQTLLAGSKIINLHLGDKTSEATLEKSVEGGIMQYSYKWGGTNGQVPIKQGPGKLLWTNLKPSNPYNPPIYIDAETNMLIYVIMGSVLGVILLVAIIVISIMYHLYRKEKTKKQLI